MTKKVKTKEEVKTGSKATPPRSVAACLGCKESGYLSCSAETEKTAGSTV